MIWQVYDTWSPTFYDRHADFTFSALKASLQDASSEIRAIGRMAVAAMCHAFPEKGKAFVKSLDGSLRQRVSQGMSAYQQGNSIPESFSHVDQGHFAFPLVDVGALSVCSTPVKAARGQVKEAQASVNTHAQRVRRSLSLTEDLNV